MTTTDITYLHEWVNNRMVRGLYIFTKEDVQSINLPISHQALQNSLSRLTDRGIIMSPWQNFYVIIPMEYRLKGIVPPAFYINKLMTFLGRDYYVSHLTAAAYNGASHQRAMLFQATVNGGPIRSGVKNGTNLEFTRRKQMPMPFVMQVKTQTGYMNVAGPELTALDIVADEKKIGGLSRAAEVLMEMCPSMHWDESKLSLLPFFSISTIQRLGFILEQIEEMDIANALFSLILQDKRTMRKTWLKHSKESFAKATINNRWKIIDNYKLEIDDI